MPVEQLAGIAIGLCLFMTLLGLLDSIATNLIGVVYPAYMSFQALQAADAAQM